jgi:hypothetical protein
MPRSLACYRGMRDFDATPEPAGRPSSATPRGRASARVQAGGIYVVQKHDATRLHYDFRLDLDGERLRGRFVLVRMKPRDGERHENWLIRERESQASAVRAPRKRASRAAARAASAATRAGIAADKTETTASASSRTARRQSDGGDDGTQS